MDYSVKCVKGDNPMPPSKVVKRDRGSRVPQGRKILQVFLDEELHRQFKAYAAMHGLTMSEMVVSSVKGMVQIDEALYSRSKYDRKK